MSQRDIPFDPFLADRLDRDLDQIGPESASPYTLWSTELWRAAARFADLDARDSEPEPDAAFVRQLGASLMGATPMDRISPQRSDAASLPKPNRKRLNVPRRPSPYASIPIAAAFVILGVAALALVAQLGNGDDRPMLPASQLETTIPPIESSVPLLDDAVDVAECSAVARPAGAVADLVGTTPATSDALPRQPGPGEDRVAELTTDDVQALLADLPEASADVRGAVTTTLRQLTACRFTLFNPFGVTSAVPPLGPYDEYEGPYFGWFTDDYFRRSIQRSALSDDPATMSLTWFPVGPFPMEIIDLRRLSDGRLIVWMQPDT